MHKMKHILFCLSTNKVAAAAILQAQAMVNLHVYFMSAVLLNVNKC